MIQTLRSRRRAGGCGLAILALLLTMCGARAGSREFPELVELPPQAAMPDPLMMLNERRVSTPAEWERERRPELKGLFEHYMYGPIPPKPAKMLAQVIGRYPDFLDGKATLKLIRLEFGSTNAPQIDLMLVVPNPAGNPSSPTARARPAVFLALNFCGNQALTADPRVPLPRGWIANSCPGCKTNTATEASRGSQATNWPLAEIVRRGYALATFWNGAVDSDRSEVSDGLYAWLAGGDPARNNPADRGTIAAWAWGFERCVDYLVGDGEVDGKRIAALGHSRNGKTALLAAAFDERIAMAFPHQAGCGGSAPSRGKSGESVKAINTKFPHWFNAQFKQFNDAPERLPFDQNCLVALCAPRPVLFSAAQGDPWSNPAGQFEVLRAADPVYRLLGTDGLAAKTMPPPRKLVDSRLGYYLREGNHSMTAADWNVFMNFADKHWAAALHPLPN